MAVAAAVLVDTFQLRSSFLLGRPSRPLSAVAVLPQRTGQRHVSARLLLSAGRLALETSPAATAAAVAVRAPPAARERQW